MINEGGCAFPLHGIDGVIDYGMSTRDYFAAQSLIAISGLWRGNLGDFDNEAADRTAKAAYRMADAMLAARTSGLEEAAARHVASPQVNCFDAQDGK